MFAESHAELHFWEFNFSLFKLVSTSYLQHLNWLLSNPLWIFTMILKTIWHARRSLIKDFQSMVVNKLYKGLLCFIKLTAIHVTMYV